MGTCKVRNEIETKRNEIKQNETKPNETKPIEIKRNEMYRRFVSHFIGTLFEYLKNRKLKINKIFVYLGHTKLNVSSLDSLAPLFP
jgi:hypothetical protein